MGRVYLNNDWRFTERFSEEITKEDFNDLHMESVRIPHTVKETPFHYFDESEYQMVNGRIRKFFLHLRELHMILLYM